MKVIWLSEAIQIAECKKFYWILARLIIDKKTTFRDILYYTKKLDAMYGGLLVEFFKANTEIYIDEILAYTVNLNLNWVAIFVPYANRKYFNLMLQHYYNRNGRISSLLLDSIRNVAKASGRLEEINQWLS